MQVLKQAADVMLLDPTAEGKDERKAKLHVTVGNFWSQLMQTD